MTHQVLMLSVFLCAAGFSAQQTPPVNSDAQVITVRVLDGKSGKPIVGDLSNVWLGNRTNDRIMKTDANGEIKISIDGVHPKSLWFLPNYYSDCRFKKDTPNGMNISYSLDQIIAEGVVAENHCSKLQAAAVPKVLVIYVRKRTFWEGMRS